MQTDDKGFYSAVGLARKAGKLVAGSHACLESIRKGTVALVIVTEDTAGNTLGKVGRACDETDTEMIVRGNSREMGRAIGRSEIKIVAIKDREFRKLILSKAI